MQSLLRTERASSTAAKMKCTLWAGTVPPPENSLRLRVSHSVFNFPRMDGPSDSPSLIPESILCQSWRPPRKAQDSTRCSRHVAADGLQTDGFLSFRTEPTGGSISGHC